tara:strand:- start:217 stop:345 length:129 start_codon:yes stop_codon:yes gene_type:complete
MLNLYKKRKIHVLLTTMTKQKEQGAIAPVFPESSQGRGFRRN